MDYMRILDGILILSIILLYVDIAFIVYIQFYSDKRVKQFKLYVMKEYHKVNQKRKKHTASLFRVYTKRAVDIVVAFFLLVTFAPIIMIILYMNSRNDDVPLKIEKIFGLNKKPVNVLCFNSNTQFMKRLVSVEKNKSIVNAIMGVPMLFSLFLGDITLVGLSIQDYKKYSKMDEFYTDAFCYEKPGIFSITSIFKDIPKHSANNIYLENRNIIFDIMIVSSCIKCS